MTLISRWTSPEENKETASAPSTSIAQQLHTPDPHAADMLDPSSTPLENSPRDSDPDPSSIMPDPEPILESIREPVVFAVEPCSCIVNTLSTPCKHSKAAFSKWIQESLERQRLERDFLERFDFLERCDLWEEMLQRKVAEGKKVRAESFERWMAKLREDFHSTPSDRVRNLRGVPFLFQNRLYNPELSGSEGEGVSDQERKASDEDFDTLPYFPSSPGLSTFLVVCQYIQDSQAKREEA